MKKLILILAMILAGPVYAFYDDDADEIERDLAHEEQVRDIQTQSQTDEPQAAAPSQPLPEELQSILEE